MRWLVLLHVLAAFWFVAGIVGRDVTLARAREERDVQLIAKFCGLAGIFDRFMVVPALPIAVALGLLVVWDQGRSLWGSGNWWVSAALLIFGTIVVLVPTVWIPRGKVFEDALTDALQQNEVTPALAAAFRDPVVAASRWYERIATAAIIVLMVTKPF